MREREREKPALYNLHDRKFIKIDMDAK